MCEPTTIAMVGIAVLGAVAAKKQGDAAAAAGSANAQISMNNSVIQQRSADDARVRGKDDADTKRIETRLLIGRQRAALAANGVLVDDGSALDLTTDTAETGELDALMVLNNAEREATAFEYRAAGFQSQAGLDTFRGQSAQQAGNLQALTSLGKGAFGAANNEGLFSSSTTASPTSDLSTFMSY